jgi:hypothetical protein
MAQLTIEYPLTGKDIEVLSGGYVNSGVLRSWVSEGRVVTGERARGRGGPRTFSLEESVKVTVMAELRKCGVPLDQAQKWGSEIAAEHHRQFEIDKPGDLEGDREWLLTQPVFYAITPSTGDVIPIMPDEAVENSLGKIIDRFGVSVTFINIPKIFADMSKRYEQVQESRRAAKAAMETNLKKYKRWFAEAASAQKNVEEAVAARDAAKGRSNKVRAAAARNLDEAIVAQGSTMAKIVKILTAEETDPDTARAIKREINRRNFFSPRAQPTTSESASPTTDRAAKSQKRRGA